MAIIKFSDWVLARESSSFTRLRQAAALGLMPPIPDASINSRSTASPFEQKALKGKGKKRRKKKVEGPINKSIDLFLKAVDDLKKDVEKVEKSKPKQTVSKKNLPKEKNKQATKEKKAKEKEAEEDKEDKE